jgi:hypothetical protein
MSFSGTNLDQGHAYNRQLVLEAIRVHGALSRADLTRLTGLAPQTISNITSMLEEARLLVAERRPSNGRGQPPIDLRLNPRGGYAFGISIDNRRLFTVLVAHRGCNHIHATSDADAQTTTARRWHRHDRPYYPWRFYRAGAGRNYLAVVRFSAGT